MAVIGRNAPCPCGSGKKYKRCHGRVIRQNGKLRRDKLPLVSTATSQDQSGPPQPPPLFTNKWSTAWSWAKRVILSRVRSGFPVRLLGGLWHWNSSHPIMTLTGLASLVAIISSIPPIYDFVDVTLNPFNVDVVTGKTPNLSSVVFDVQNRGKIPLESVLFTCAVDNLTVERPDGRRFRVNFDPKQIGWIDSANAKTKLARFAVGDSTPFVCNAQRMSGGWNFGGQSVPIVSARLRGLASFELPVIREWKRCFVSQVFFC